MLTEAEARHTAAEHENAGSSATSNGGLAGARVLICEDEAIIQVQLNRMLTGAGMEVVASAVNGKHGIELAAETNPDIVLMDLNIPVIDGMEAARRIIVNQSPCVVILSAYGDSDFRKRAKEIGVCGYITKPITSELLLPELDRIYSEFRAARATQ
jgi:two-component system, response regulator PdtaR